MISAEDLAICEEQAHVVVVPIRVLDQQQEAILDVVRAIRRRHPEWPIIVVQTALHEGYLMGAGHVLPYPFKERDPAAIAAAGVSLDLIRSMMRQRSLFEGVPGNGAIAFVPVDFTLAGDGWEPADYGYDAFIETLQNVAPAAVVTGCRTCTAMRVIGSTGAHPHILGYATAAGAADIGRWRESRWFQAFRPSSSTPWEKSMG